MMGMAIVRFILNMIFYGLLRLRVVGAENIPAERAVIMASNHKSYWDPPLVGIACRHRLVHFMAKSELFKNPVFGGAIRWCGAFPVHRGRVDRQSIKTALTLLRQGEVLGIFPEGTRIRREGLGKFHSGVASLAFLTGTPILPVAVLHSRELPFTLKRPVVLIGEPIEVEKQKPSDEAAAELTALVKSRMEALITDYQKKAL